MIGPKLKKNKNSYKVQNVKCMGSFQCRHIDCPHFQSKGVHNLINWTRDRCGRNEVPFLEGRDVPSDSIICSFCKRPPRCIGRCPAVMWYINPTLDNPHYIHKSCIAMHVR